MGDDAMSRALILRPRVAAAGGGGGITEPFFTESFAGGQFNNANGFTWDGTGSTPSSPRVSISSARARTGTHSLQFSYNPTMPNVDQQAEQRFALGRDCSEFALEFYWYLPSNFNNPSSNKKLWEWWRDLYGGEDGAWAGGMEFNLNVGVDNFHPISTTDLSNVLSDITGGALNEMLVADGGPLNVGAWNRMRYYLKAASSRGASDGIYKFWGNDTLVINVTNGRFHNHTDTTGPAVIRNGYLMGYANAGYSEPTVFNIDDISMWDTNPGWT